MCSPSHNQIIYVDLAHVIHIFIVKSKVHALFSKRDLHTRSFIRYTTCTCMHFYFIIKQNSVHFSIRSFHLITFTFIFLKLIFLKIDFISHVECVVKFLMTRSSHTISPSLSRDVASVYMNLNSRLRVPGMSSWSAADHPARERINLTCFVAYWSHNHKVK